MKLWIGIAVLLVMSLASGAPAPAQMPVAPQNPTIASTLDFQLSLVEREFVSAAEAMPEEKYSFAPTNGEFKGVRTFAQQIKHVATSNDRFFGAILGQAVSTGPAEGEGSNGPDSIQTKEQILKYLRDSFALGHKAIATITPENALVVVKTPPISFLKTPLALAGFGPAHAMDHYGQIVEYLRMNGLVPPASRPRPAASRPTP
jgi:hypothetical protein